MKTTVLYLQLQIWDKTIYIVSDRDRYTVRFEKKKSINKTWIKDQVFFHLL